MKRYILLLVTFFPVWIIAQNLTPEHTWHDAASASKSKWYTAQFGSTVFSFNGKMYAFNYYDDGNYNGGHTYVFKLNWNHDYANLAPYNLGSSRSNKLVFGYDNESSSFDPGPIRGKTFCFQYDNRMWYYQHIKNEAGEHENDKNESYECFALFPLDTLQSCTTYYEKHGPPPDITKMGAFQLDSNLCIIGQNTNSSSSDYNKWFIQEYYFTSSDNRFHHRKDLYISEIPTTHNMAGGIVRKMDSQGNEYFIINTYQYNGSTKIWKFMPVSGPTGTEFTCTNFATTTQSDNAVVIISEGSIKGNRTTDSNPDKTDRIISYAIQASTNSNGIHSLWCLEYYITDDGNGNTSLTPILPGTTITIPTSTGPSKGAGNYIQLLATYELVPTVFTQALSGSTDGYQQYIWLLYPDGDKHWNGVMLESDKWRMTGDPIVSSSDLGDKGTYPGIDGLWSLIGICDGGPPVPIDWEIWEDPLNHPPGTEPTELEFTMTAGHESEVASTYEDQWSIGEDMEMSKHIMKLETSLSEEFKYSSTFKNTVSKAHEVKKTLKETFALMESNQDSAVLVWAIPTITRYPFSLFPWWDTGLTYRVPNSDQYMFRTAGISLIKENVPISQSPFLIEDANAPDMMDWKPENRPEILNANLYYGIDPIMNPTWTNNQVGDDPVYDITANSSDSYEQTTEWELNSTVGVQVPKVFKVDVSAGYKVSYSTETTVKNNYGTEITCSLLNLKTNTVGPKIDHLNLSVYWFRYKQFTNGTYPDWWYWQDFGDQKPWYIAYVSNNTKTTVKLLTPQNHAVAGASDLYFSWMAESGMLQDYMLIIANSSYIDNTSIVYKQSAGKGQNLSLPGFIPEAGKTYYWQVKGMTDDGVPVWSNISSFRMKADQDVEGPVLKALVYPNPADKNEIHVAIDPVVSGPYSVKLTNMNGIVLLEQQGMNTDGLPVDIRFKAISLPAGIYFAVITAGEEQIVKKIMIR